MYIKHQIALERQTRTSCDHMFNKYRRHILLWANFAVFRRAFDAGRLSSPRTVGMEDSPTIATENASASRKQRVHAIEAVVSEVVTRSVSLMVRNVAPCEGLSIISVLAGGGCCLCL